MPKKKLIQAELVPIEVYKGGKWVPGRILGLPVNTIFRFSGECHKTNCVGYRKGWVCLSVTEGVQVEGEEKGAGGCVSEVYTNLEGALYDKRENDICALMRSIFRDVCALIRLICEENDTAPVTKQI